MTREQYQGISFPKSFIEFIKKHVAENAEYNTVTGFIRFAAITQVKKDNKLKIIDDLK